MFQLFCQKEKFRVATWLNSMKFFKIVLPNFMNKKWKCNNEICYLDFYENIRKFKM